MENQDFQNTTSGGSGGKSFLCLLIGIALGFGLNQVLDLSPVVKAGATPQALLWEEASDSEVVAEVQGKAIYQDTVKEELSTVPQNKKAQKLMHLILQDLVRSLSRSLESEQSFQGKVSKMKQELRVSEFLKRELDVKEPSRQEMLDYFLKNKAKYHQEEGFKISHMILKTPLARQETPQNLKSFREMTRERSLSIDKFTGGKVRKWVSSNSFVPVGEIQGLRVFLQNHQQGFCGPLESSRGYHYFWIEARRKAHKPPFENLIPRLRNDLLAENHKKAQSRYFENLVRKHGVKIHYEKI